MSVRKKSQQRHREKSISDGPYTRKPKCHVTSSFSTETFVGRRLCAVRIPRKNSLFKRRAHNRLDNRSVCVCVVDRHIGHTRSPTAGRLLGRTFRKPFYRWRRKRFATNVSDLIVAEDFFLLNVVVSRAFFIHFRCPIYEARADL